MEQATFLEVRSVTIRRQLSLIMLILIAVTVIINSLISTNYIDGYFKNYVSEQYDENVKAIVTFSKNIVSEGSVGRMRAQSELDNFIDDPIVALSIFDSKGNQIAYAEDSMFNMHQGMMMGRMFDVENDTISLSDGIKEVGVLVITRNSDIQSSETVRLFKNAMLMGALISAIVVLIVSFALIHFSSKKITRDLTQTAQYAKDIELGKNSKVSDSNTLEIRALQISLQNLSNKLKLQKAARKQKTDQLAHETRTPLTILRTHCEGALDGVVDMDSSRLENCLNQIKNLSFLISNMNDVIEYESNEPKIEISEYDLVKEIKKIIKGLSVQYKKKGIDLIYIGPESFIVKMDSTLLNQALYNLLTNAYKFTNEGIVKATLLDSEGSWSLSVEDTGDGIANDEVERIFEAYYRSDKALNIEGDGLGLYITRNNIERVGGKIFVESETGKGTSFTLKFSKRKFVNPQHL